MIPPLAARPKELAKRAGFWFSGFLIALSFVSMLVPLAAYHLAQVAAAMRVRIAAGLLFAVAATCLLLGGFFRLEALLVGGFAALLWAPILLGTVYLRSRAGPSLLAALLSLVPLLIGLVALLSAPVTSLTSEVWKLKVDQAFSELLKSPETSNPKVSKDIEAQRTEFLKEAEKFVATAEFDLMVKVLAKSPAQRLFWVVFEKGNGLLFFFIVICLSNFLLVDLAQSQVARFRTLVQYVLAKRSQFTAELLARLQTQAVPYWISGKAPNPREAEVLAFKMASRKPDQKANQISQMLSQIWMPKMGPRFARFWGGEFEFGKGPWDLRALCVPLWACLISIVWLGFVAWMNPNHFQADASSVVAVDFFESWASWIQGLAGLASLVSFFVLTWLSLQGVLVLYARLAPLVLVVFVFIMLVAGPLFALNPFLGFALLGGLGLLDEAFDLRGCRKLSSVPALA